MLEVRNIYGNEVAVIEMQLWEIMSGAEKFPGAVDRPRRGIHSKEKNNDVVEINAEVISTPLQLLTARWRRCNSLIPFSSPNIKCKNGIYQRASTLAIRSVSLTPIEAACKVAATFGVNISVANRHLIGACVRTRVKATNEFPKPGCVSSRENSL